MTKRDSLIMDQEGLLAKEQDQAGPKLSETATTKRRISLWFVCPSQVNDRLCATRRGQQQRVQVHPHIHAPFSGLFVEKENTGLIGRCGWQEVLVLSEHEQQPSNYATDLTNDLTNMNMEDYFTTVL
jgi:hypothetical protein